MSKSPESRLVSTARALQEDLSRFEAQSAELARVSINSEKTMQRARQTLESCSEQEAKLAESLREFALAIQEMQQTQQRCMEQTEAATLRIQERQAQRQQLHEHLARLGQNARELSGPVSELPNEAESPPPETLARLEEVEGRLSAVISEAAEVTALAQRDDWADIEQDTRSLQQQLQAIRNRVLLCRRKVASQAPS
jgi:chromosome segregation ATPase